MTGENDTRTEVEILADIDALISGIAAMIDGGPRPSYLAVPPECAEVLEALNDAHERGDSETVDAIGDEVLARFVEAQTGPAMVKAFGALVRSQPLTYSNDGLEVFEAAARAVWERMPDDHKEALARRADTVDWEAFARIVVLDGPSTADLLADAIPEDGQ